MTANINERGTCRSECDVTWHHNSAHPEISTHGQPGDVRRCEHCSRRPVMAAPTPVTPKPDTCPGPMIWFSVGQPEEDAAILECPCGYVITTGNFNDERHAYTPWLRSHE